MRCHATDDRLANRCHLESADVLHLLSTMLEELGCEDFCSIIGCLENMSLGPHLSTQETLMLLTKIVKGKNG